MAKVLILFFLALSACKIKDHGVRKECSFKSVDSTVQGTDTNPLTTDESQNSKGDSLVTVQIAPVLFEYSFPGRVDTFKTLEDYLRYEKVNLKDTSFNAFFKPGARLNFRPEEVNNDEWGHPYEGKAYLYKILSNESNMRILLFAYQILDSKDSNSNLFTIELQTFDRQFKMIDRMIVADAVIYEDGSWTRTFKCFKNYYIEILDKYTAWDLVIDKNILDTTYVSNFRINEKGIILPVSNIVGSIERWVGKYSMVLNQDSQDWRDHLTVELTITRDGVTYKHNGYQMYNEYLLAVTETGNMLRFDYQSSIAGIDHTLDTERDFGLLVWESGDYSFACPYLDAKVGSCKTIKRKMKKQ